MRVKRKYGLRPVARRLGKNEAMKRIFPVLAMLLSLIIPLLASAQTDLPEPEPPFESPPQQPPEIAPPSSNPNRSG